VNRGSTVYGRWSKLRCLFDGQVAGIQLGGEERRLRVFENLVLRGVFGTKRDEVTWE
jgi:hypothetical protein